MDPFTLLGHFCSLKTQQGLHVGLGWLWGACRNAISIHAPISSWTVPLLSLSGVNYWAHRFRLCQQFDGCSYLSVSTSERDYSSPHAFEPGIIGWRFDNMRSDVFAAQVKLQRWSDSNSWLRKFKPLRNEIESLTDWIDDVWNRKFYLRHSVYNARIKKA